jgi:hypothetical protein
MHPLARFAATIREARSAGITPRPATAMQVSVGDNVGLEQGRYIFAIEQWAVEAVVPIDRLMFLGASLIDGQIVAAEQAERAVISALTLEPPLLRLSTSEVQEAHDVLVQTVLPALAAKATDFHDAEAARHYDLAETQRALITEHSDRRRREAETRIRDYRLRPDGRGNQIALAEGGKLNKFLARMELKLDELRKRETNFSISEPVCVAVLVVDVVGAMQ